jgi:hypothetical protein
MGVPYKYKPEMCTIVDQVLSDGESLAAVCAELNITRETLYTWRDTHPEFADALRRGLQKAQRVWEKIGKNGIIGNYEKFNGAPWIFTMKNRFRADYAEEKEKTEDKSVIEMLIDKLAE